MQQNTVTDTPVSKSTWSKSNEKKRHIRQATKTVITSMTSRVSKLLKRSIHRKVGANNYVH